MSDSNWRSIVSTWIAIAVLLLAASGYMTWQQLRHEAPQAVSNDYESSRYADRAQERIDRICVGLSGVDLLHCEYEIEQPERENHRAQKDLRAQRYMAIWAFFMTAFTFGTLIVTGLGVFYVRQTLLQTGDTNRAAVEAAKAALEANEIMRQEQRPWLVIDVVSMKCGRNHGEFWIGRNIKITNRGNSPAFDVQWSSKFTSAAIGASNTYEKLTTRGIQSRKFGEECVASSQITLGTVLPGDNVAHSATGPADGFTTLKAPGGLMCNPPDMIFCVTYKLSEASERKVYTAQFFTSKSSLPINQVESGWVDVQYGEDNSGKYLT